MTDDEEQTIDPLDDTQAEKVRSSVDDTQADIEDHLDDGLFDDVDEAEGNSGKRQFKPPSALENALKTTAGTLLLKYLNPPWLEPDRPRGVLSQADREFLLGLKDYSHKQSRANRKQTIRERVEHSLYDFTLLWMILPPLERERVLDAMNDTDAATSIDALITFAYLSVDQNATELERRIENGVLAGASYDPEGKEDGTVTNVSVSIDIDYQPSVDELRTKLQERANELTPEEIGILVRVGELDSEDLETLEESRTDSLSVGGEAEEELESDN